MAAKDLSDEKAVQSGEIELAEKKGKGEKKHSISGYKQGSSYFTNATTVESKAGKPIRLRDYMESDEIIKEDTNPFIVRMFLILLGFGVLYVGYTVNMYVWMELLTTEGDALLWAFCVAGVLFFGGMMVLVAVMMKARGEGLWEEGWEDEEDLYIFLGFDCGNIGQANRQA